MQPLTRLELKSKNRFETLMLRSHRYNKPCRSQQPVRKVCKDGIMNLQRFGESLSNKGAIPSKAKLYPLTCVHGYINPTGS